MCKRTSATMGVWAMVLAGCAGIGAAGHSDAARSASLGSAIGEGVMEEKRQSAPAASRRMKFCPVGGEFYDESIKSCPIHGAELMYKESSKPGGESDE